ncbi:hypothetical protein FRC03_004118 [Tulasnella sp. 419]|nr:hypothetical protein FRC03_004118 [Tulasnella sp. 419]
MPPSAPAAAKRALPTKENALFKSLLQLYETRQYKRAQKIADQILKKVPEHGETTSMKGLVLYNLHKKEEGLELVKKGVLLDLTSHICWHVLGIVHKADRNYEEALKCYLQALRFDKDNINILRDAAQLQLQLRNYDGLQETRLTLLKLRPNLRLSWIGLAVAYQLRKQPAEACNVIEQYLKTLKGIPDYDVEHSELLLYYIRMLEEVEKYDAALQFLDSSAKARSIVDRRAIMTTRAHLLSKLGRTDEAEEGWKALIEHNSECYDYYRGYLSNKNIDLDHLTPETRETALSVFREFSSQLPRATAPKRWILTLSSGDEFKNSIREYLLSGFTRGIPSLYADVKSLYQDPEKLLVIGEIVEELAAQYSSQTQLTNGSASDPSDEPEPPTTYLWILYFLAQHKSYISPTDPTSSLALVDTAIQHTPTLPELHSIKARILKRAGDPVGASICMEEARKLDLQDRFLNTKSGKYILRDGQIEVASNIFGLFTKKDAPSPGTDLEEMQSLLYLVEEGKSYMGIGRLSMALKRFRGVAKTFNDFEDDQFDFHSYCLRRHTLNAHEGLLKFEDRLRSHPAYIASALNAARIYIRVHDDPSVIASSAPPKDTEEEKKAKKKAKKAAAKAPPPPPQNQAKDDDAPPPPPKDEDPDGMKLLSTGDPLLEASKLLRPLEPLQIPRVDIWMAIFDVALRRKKYLQALKAIEHALKLDNGHPELHHRIVEFKQTMSTALEGLPPHVKSFVQPSLDTLISPETILERYNTDFLQRRPGDPAVALGYAKALFKIGKAKEDVENAVFEIVNENVGPDILTSLEAVDFMETMLKSSRTAELKGALQARYPKSTVFKSTEERDQLRKALKEGTDNEEGKRETGPV